MAHRPGQPAFREPNPASPAVLNQSLKDYAVITLDREGTIVQWSSGAERIFGYTPAEITGRHFAALFTPEDLAANRPAEELRNAVAKQTAEDQRWHMRKDGSRVWLSGTVSPVHNDAGELAGFSKIARDITSQKLAELQKEALLERERAARAQAEQEWLRMEEIADKIPAGIALVRLPDKIYVFANRTFQELLGDRKAIGMQVGAVHLEADRALGVFEEAVRTRTAQSANDCPVRFGAAPGAEVRYFDIACHPIPTGAFPYDSILIFAVEVTDRVRARQLARHHATSVEEQANLLDLAHDGIMAMNMDGAIEFWNRGAEDMYGWTKQEALGRNVHELLGTDLPLPLARVEEILRTEGEWSGELKHRSRTGRELEVWSRWVLRKHDGIPSGWLEVTRDVTERKRLEAHLRDAQKLESLGVLAGGIAHDFNNLLVGILGNVSLAQERIDPSSDLAPLLQEAADASERAAFLTRQMLAYAGKGHMFVSPVDLSRVVRDAMILVRGSIPQNVDVELDLGDRLPCVQGDALQLQQVAMNLMLNAAEAVGGERGRVTVRTGVQEIDDRAAQEVAYDVGKPAPGRYATLEVEDCGPGIEASVRPNIFDPFYTTKFTGRGLGLAAVAGIVRALKGAIRVQSSPGQPTSFLVLFPAEE
ncbi:MAG TPA: PAS domain S-box protein [Bryobacteraceae bacterium]|nr:PAS domain S-box protein [Bryobacteraceae bacterium]